MRVLVLPVDGVPHVLEIDGSLAAMQQLVAGYIEVANRFPDHTVIVCDEEGRLKEQPRNPYAWNLFGQVFVCRAKGPELVGLTDEDVAKWLALARAVGRLKKGTKT